MDFGGMFYADNDTCFQCITFHILAETPSLGENMQWVIAKLPSLPIASCKMYLTVLKTTQCGKLSVSLLFD